MKLYTISLFAFLFLVTTNVIAQEEECFPDAPNSPVYDELNLLSKAEKLELQKNLVIFEKNTSVQIAVAVINDICGYDVGDYSTRLAEKWGIGKEGEDNGLLFLIKPTGSKRERKMFISVGYGLEEVVTDASTKLIIEKEIIPRFKQGQMYSGIISGISVLMDLCQKKYTPEEYVIKNKPSPYLNLILLGVFILLFYILYKGRKNNQTQYTKDGKRMNSSGLGDALFMGMLFSSFGGRGGGNSGGFGGGGGGFGGFGGGGFGGGGAGGSW